MPVLNPALLILAVVAIAVGVVTYRRTRNWGRVALSIAGVIAGFYAVAALAHLLGFE